MKPPEYRNLVREDFAEAPWIEKLIRPLNAVLGQVRAALANGLTLGENLNAQVKTLDVTLRDEFTSLTLGAKFSPYTADMDGHYQGLQYRILPGHEIALRGMIAPNATVTEADIIATLPVDVRPGVAHTFPVASVANNVHWTVHTDGTMHCHGTVPASSQYVSSDGVRFKAGGVPPANSAWPVRFKSTIRGKAVGVLVLRVAEVRGREEFPLAVAATLSWDQDGENITIRNMAGLVGKGTGVIYRLTLAVIGG